MTMTMTIPNVKRAMMDVGLGDRINDLFARLDEMALDAMLAESIAQANRGEGRPAEEFERELDEEFAKGYYGRV